MSLSIYLRAHLASIYLPTSLTAMAMNAMQVLLPLYVLHLGYSPEIAALIFACSGFGMLLGDLPGGRFIAQFGDKNGMLMGTAIVSIAYLFLGLTTNLWILGLSNLAIGFGSSGSVIARQSYLTERYKAGERGRVISLLGGMMRGGGLFGPLIGGFLVTFWDYSTAFYMLSALSFVSILFVYFSVEHNTETHKSAHSSSSGTLAVLKEHRRIFLTVGSCMMTLQLMRASRALLIPLVGASLGLEISTITAIVAAGSALDVILFYPAGIIMDKKGRKYAAIPCFLFYSLGLFILSMSSGEIALLAASIILGLGNGLSSGLALTLGADYAPHNNRGTFLGAWRLISDVGMAGAPTFISLIITLGNLRFSGILTGATGIFAALFMFLAVKEPLKQHSERQDK